MTSPLGSIQVCIFGRHVQINGIEVSPAGQNLVQALSLYPQPSPNTSPDLVIDYGKPDTSPSPARGMINPAIHHTYEDGFSAILGSIQLRLIFDQSILKHIAFGITSSESPFMQTLLRFKSRQYTSPQENIGHLFHELVMVPSIFFDSEHFLVHASALKLPNNQVILIGGTGGVGKTSLEIELCLNHQCQFIADDISVVSQDGYVWPNLSYPKIYAYNLVNKPLLQERIFAERGIIDRMHWKLHHTLRGPQYVRRAESPQTLYGGYSREGGALSKYIILLREHRDHVDIRPIDASTAAFLTRTIIQTEYTTFINHILWDEYNHRLMGTDAPFSLQAILNRWTLTAEQVFSGIECFAVHIPVGMKHEQFKQEMTDFIVGGTHNA